jgi:hypothetical protein
MLATGAVGRLKRRSRPVNGPLRVAFDSVNSLFAILFHSAEKARKSAVFESPSKLVIGTLEPLSDRSGPNLLATVRAESRRKPLINVPGLEIRHVRTCSHRRFSVSRYW